MFRSVDTRILRDPACGKSIRAGAYFKKPWRIEAGGDQRCN